MSKSHQPEYNDSAFLYLIFTAQFFLILYLLISLLRQFCNKRQKSTRSLALKSFILLAVCAWFYQVFQLIQEEQANSTSKDFDPYAILNVDQGEFNSQKVRKAYRNLAVKYHPDKHVGSSDMEKVRQDYFDLVKAYEILTDETKYDNWKKYGNPDGSVAMKAVEIALPSFLLKPENSGMVLSVFLVLFICLPIGSVISHMRQRERVHRNGLMNENRIIIIKKIAQLATINEGRCQFTQENMIQIYEEAIELQQINELLNKKTTVKDLIQQVFKVGDVQPEFKEAQSKIIDIITRLNEILLEEQSISAMMKGRIQVRGQLFSLKVVDALTSMQTFTSQFLQRRSEASTQAFSVELKSYVDGLEDNEPIQTGYVLTFDIKVKQQAPPKLSKYEVYHIGMLLDDANGSQPMNIFPIKLVINDSGRDQQAGLSDVQFPQEVKFQKLLTQTGLSKYSVVIFSNDGHIFKSNQSVVSVKKGVKVDEDEVELNQDEQYVDSD
eukprot:403351874